MNSCFAAACSLRRALFKAPALALALRYAAMIAPAPAWAASAELKPGVSDASGANSAYAIDAAHIRADQALTSGGALAGLSFGGAKQLELGRVHSQVSRILLRFDLTSLAEKSAQFTRARLTLTVRLSQIEPAQESFPTTLALRLYKIAPANGDWFAGTADGAAQAGAACWSARKASGSLWAGLSGCGLGGVDFVAAPVAVAVGHASFYQSGDPFVFDLADPDQFRDWAVHPAKNAGFLLTADALEASPADGVQSLQFYSDEATANVAGRPSLAIDYVPAAEPGYRSAADTAWMSIK